MISEKKAANAPITFEGIVMVMITVISGRLPAGNLLILH